MSSSSCIDFLKKKWQHLKGKDEDFSVQAQIYHSFSIVIIIALFVIITINLLLGLNVSALLCGMAIATQSIVFYQSRFKGKLKLAIIISCVQSNFFLCINYFFNAGIAGPTLMVCSVTLFIILTVVSKQKMFTWFVINLLLATAIVFLECKFPFLIMNTYSQKADLFTDNLTGYIINIMLLYIGTTYIRDSYEKEKKSANDKALTLQKLNNEKNKLFSIISHDLKTPLASIQQYLDLLTQMELDTEERKWIEANLLKATTNTQELLTNLLQWSKTQMEGPEINLSPINLKQNFKNALDVIKVVAQTKNITINSLIDDEIIVIADSNMLQLVLRNLLHNALKFTNKGGKVDVVASTMANKCLISIIDNGVGMDKATQDEIFSLRISSTFGTENENGTGLGLLLCKEYTQLQGGKIWFSSQKNVGTVFNVSLPLKKVVTG